MSSKLSTKYPHIKFAPNWRLTDRSMFLLGQCQAYVKAISRSPILPDLYGRLLNVALIKGAQATTAIEGNTLTEEEVGRVHQGQHVSPSKKYQEIEVRNILNAFNDLMREIINGELCVISSELIKRFHLKVGKDLGENFEAIPGQYRTSARNVGSYKCPDHEDVEELIDSFCAWIRKEFHYEQGQEFWECVIQAIVSHVYIEWIHPFGDGNGRTGRLLEFYILIRGDNPDIGSHILSNHYNETRPVYYKELEQAGKTGDLTKFIEYALEGLRDGLDGIIGQLQNSQIEITWHKYIYDKFAEKKYTKNVFQRQRDLILSFTPGLHSFEKVSVMDPLIAKRYANLSDKTLRRDLDELIELGLVVKINSEYKANVNSIVDYFPVKKTSIGK